VVEDLYSLMTILKASSYVTFYGYFISAFYHEYKELHLTNIRNEAAYFSCIKKVGVRTAFPLLKRHRKNMFVDYMNP